MTKKNSPYLVREFALGAGKTVITPVEIANIPDKPKNISAVYTAAVAR